MSKCCKLTFNGLCSLNNLRHRGSNILWQCSQLLFILWCWPLYYLTSTQHDNIPAEPHDCCCLLLLRPLLPLLVVVYYFHVYIQCIRHITYHAFYTHLQLTYLLTYLLSLLLFNQRILSHKSERMNKRMNERKGERQAYSQCWLVQGVLCKPMHSCCRPLRHDAAEQGRQHQQQHSTTHSQYWHQS